jgi:hypothetical protein
MHTQKCNLFSMKTEGPPAPGITACMCDCAASVYSHGLHWAIIVRADWSPDNGHGSVLLDPIWILASDKLHYALHRSQISVTKSEIRNRSIIDYCGN